MPSVIGRLSVSARGEVVRHDAVDGVVDRRAADLGDGQVRVALGDLRRGGQDGLDPLVGDGPRPASLSGRRRRARPAASPSGRRPTGPAGPPTRPPATRRARSAAPRRPRGSRPASRSVPRGAWISTRSVRSAGKPACSRRRSARPDSPAPVSPSVRVLVPAIDPPATAATTRAIHSSSAVHRCRVLQRASRSAAPGRRVGASRPSARRVSGGAVRVIGCSGWSVRRGPVEAVARLAPPCRRLTPPSLRPAAEPGWGQPPGRSGGCPAAAHRPGSLAWSPRHPPSHDPTRTTGTHEEEHDMRGRWVTRWVATPLLELGYLVLGLFAGVVTFTVDRHLRRAEHRAAARVPARGAAWRPSRCSSCTAWPRWSAAARPRCSGSSCRAARCDPSRTPAGCAGPCCGSGRRSSGRRRRTPCCCCRSPRCRRAWRSPFWSAAVAGLALPLYADALPGDDGRHLAALVGADRRRRPASRPASSCCCSPGCSRPASPPPTSDWPARCCRRATPMPCVLQVTSLRETRARVVDAADAERRRIERDLHDGAQQHLVALAMNLGRAKEKMETRPRGGARARGAGPPGGEGLDHRAARRRPRRAPGGAHRPRSRRRAVRAGRPLPGAGARWTSTCPSARAPTVEAIAYFVVSEALTNVAKHSGADPRHRARRARRRPAARLGLRRRPRRRHRARRAAAWPACATGSRAVDGTFRLQSSPTGGTTVTVEVPCAS